MPDWLKLMLLALVALGAVAGLTLWVAAMRWDRATEAMRARLAADAAARAATGSSGEEIADLPAPVARYFAAALINGRRMIARARITWTGEFNMGQPGLDKWAPFTAVQDFVPGAPGMVWDARIAMAPGVTVRVRDGFVNGAGSMHGAVLGLVTVVHSEGTPDMATAALQRYIAEATWLPTALLPGQGVQWTAIDDTRARATLAAGAIAASVEFRFGADGLVESMFVPDRLFDDGKRPPSKEAWQARILGVESREGVRVPGDAVVEWLLPQGAYAYWRGRPVAIEFTYAGN